jgi:hypothetical protein
MEGEARSGYVYDVEDEGSRDGGTKRWPVCSRWLRGGCHRGSNVVRIYVGRGKGGEGRIREDDREWRRGRRRSRDEEMGGVIVRLVGSRVRGSDKKWRGFRIEGSCVEREVRV